MPLLAHDDAVMHYDAEILGRRYDLLGHFDMGVGSPDGWLCTSTIAVADSSSGRFTISRT
jgi:hypothetical protein